MLDRRFKVGLESHRHRDMRDQPIAVDDKINPVVLRELGSKNLEVLGLLRRPARSRKPLLLHMIAILRSLVVDWRICVSPSAKELSPPKI